MDTELGQVIQIHPDQVLALKEHTKEVRLWKGPYQARDMLAYNNPRVQASGQ